MGANVAITDILTNIPVKGIVGLALAKIHDAGHVESAAGQGNGEVQGLGRMGIA